MKPIIAAAAVLALGLGACAPPAPQQEAPPTEAATPINAPSGDYNLDPNHTTVTVRADHFGLSHYVLRFNTVSGALTFNAEDPIQSRVTATVDVNSLSTPFRGARNFDDELKNSEWLDAATYPTATFTSTSAERTGPNTGRVTGDLSIRGVTHPATFEVRYNASHAQHPLGPPVSMIGFSARTEISRRQYGLNVLQPDAGAFNGVGDMVELLIEAEFTRPVQQASDIPPAP